MPSRIVPLYLDIRFNAHPQVCGGELLCPNAIPPRSGEGIIWVDPKTQKLALWHIQRIEYYHALGYPKDGIPKASKAAGAVWLDKIADVDSERPTGRYISGVCWVKSPASAAR